jgi:hypothetical protein
LVWMAAVLRGMRFWMQSSNRTVKERCSIYHCNASIPCRCLQTTKKQMPLWPFPFIPPVYFIIFRTLDSSIPTSRPILKLLWPRSAHHIGGAVWGMNCLQPLKHWDPRFESHSRHGCLCVFVLLSCLYVATLRQADPRSKES